MNFLYLFFQTNSLQMIIFLFLQNFCLGWAGRVVGVVGISTNTITPYLHFFYTKNCKCSKVSPSDCWSLPLVIDNVKIWGRERTIAHVFFTITPHCHGLCVLRHSRKKHTLLQPALNKPCLNPTSVAEQQLAVSPSPQQCSHGEHVIFSILSYLWRVGD